MTMYSCKGFRQLCSVFTSKLTIFKNHLKFIKKKGFFVVHTCFNFTLCLKVLYNEN
jgi:hypothetical protein